MPAYRTIFRHLDSLFAAITLLNYRFNNFRDDIPGPLNQDMVTSHYPFAFDFALVVQGCPADHHTADVYRFKDCYRRYGTGAAHLEFSYNFV